MLAVVELVPLSFDQRRVDDHGSDSHGPQPQSSAGQGSIVAKMIINSTLITKDNAHEFDYATRL